MLFLILREFVEIIKLLQSIQFLISDTRMFCLIKKRNLLEHCPLPLILHNFSVDSLISSSVIHEESADEFVNDFQLVSRHIECICTAYLNVHCIVTHMIKLICMDMDGVLTQVTNFWLKLHEAWGVKEEGYELTRKYLRTDYAMLMRSILDAPDGIWIGKSEHIHQDLVHSIPLSEGIDEFFHELDRFEVHGTLVPRAVISSGPHQLAQRIQKRHRIDFIFANELLFEEGVYKGRCHWNMRSGNEYKVDVLHQLCDDLEILPQEVLYIGDDQSDLEIFKEVGVSIAFNTENAFHSKHEELRKTATYIVDSNNLSDLIPILRKIRQEAGAGLPTFEPGSSP
jgi:phosphoserine phosphatase